MLDFDEDGEMKYDKRGRKRKSSRVYASYDRPSIPWQKVQAVINTVGMMFIVLAFLLIAFFIYSDSPTVKKIELYTGDMARMTRTVTQGAEYVRNTIPPFNTSDVLKSMWPQTDAEAYNVTERGKRVISDVGYLISDVKESGVIGTVGEIGKNVVNILSRPNFDNLLDSLEVGVPLIFDTLKKDDTKAFIHVLQAILEKAASLLTEERVDKVIDIFDKPDMKNLLVHTAAGVKEYTKVATSLNKILDKAVYIVEHEDEYIIPVIHKVQHVSEFMSERITEESIDNTIATLKTIDWNNVGNKANSVLELLNSLKGENTEGKSTMDLVKQLIEEATILTREVEQSGLIDTSADALNKLNGALSKNEIHQGYIQGLSTLKKINEGLEELGEHHVMSDLISLVERFERMERIVETVFSPLERGMDLYNEEQARENGGKRGNIKSTRNLISSIENKS